MMTIYPNKTFFFFVAFSSLLTSWNDTVVVNAETCITSEGDQAVGVFAYFDPTCANGGIGCFQGDCRHCQQFSTEQSMHLLYCPSPEDLCETDVTDQDVGVFAFYDPDCSLPNGGNNPNTTLGCFGGRPQVCRHCQEFETPQSEHLVPCPPGNGVSSPPPTPYPTPQPTPGSPQRCDTDQSDQDVGVFAYYDQTCLHPSGGTTGTLLGCFGHPQVCRHCKEFDTEQSDHLLDCPPS